MSFQGPSRAERAHADRTNFFHSLSFYCTVQSHSFIIQPLRPSQCAFRRESRARRLHVTTSKLTKSDFLNRSDASFAAIDAGLDDVLSLSEENARLRAMLAAVQTAPITVKVTSPVEADAVTLAKELAAARAAQQQAERELQVLRGGHPAVVADAVEDQSSEVGLLRSSLAALASELELEKNRAREAEALREEETSKVHNLRSKMEESRRALMRMQGETQRRLSNDMYAPVARRASGIESTIPRRRSSLGLASSGGVPVATPVPVSGVGLGLAVESPSLSVLSTSPAGKASPLHRFATRRGSASFAPELREEDDRAAKLRDLRLGVTTTKVASRRGSLANGLPDFFGLGDFDFDADRKLNAPQRFGRHGSISEEACDPYDRPPSAPLRLDGRKNSVAVFENWSRRSSTSSCGSFTFGSMPSGSALSDYSSSPMDTDERLLMQLEGLKIQLAESEEGRRASELCVKALKDFIATRPDGSAISLPPLPTDSASATFEPRRASSGSRWSIPRLSFGAGSRSSSPASSTSPNLTTWTRRTSATSTSSHTTSKPPLATPLAPTFGGFSFSALVARPSTADDGDTSPTMGGPSGQSGLFQTTSFPTEPSPQLQDDSADFSPSNRDSSCSTAPSLSSASSTSSRSPSPVDDDDEDDEDELHDEPEIILASAENFSLAPSKGYLKDTVRMSALPSGLGLGM